MPQFIKVSDKVIEEIKEFAVKLDLENNILPASEWQKLSDTARKVFCHESGLYGIPTKELILHLNTLIDNWGFNRNYCVEIGAGLGWLGQGLGIKCTDSKYQATAEGKSAYKTMRQPTIDYGKHVRKIDALGYVSRYEPDLVIASWVSHRFNPKKPEMMGFLQGVKFDRILDHCRKLILIGNDGSDESGHVFNPILEIEHETHRLPFLMSRSATPNGDFLKIWNGYKK